MQIGKWVSWVSDLGGLALGLVVLFHTYSTKDTAVVVAFLVLLYGMIRSHMFGEGIASAMYFLELAKRVRQQTNGVDKSTEFDLEFAARSDVPHLAWGSVCSLALALIAGAKLLVALFLFT